MFTEHTQKSSRNEINIVLILRKMSLRKCSLDSGFSNILRKRRKSTESFLNQKTPIIDKKSNWNGRSMIIKLIYMKNNFAKINVFSYSDIIFRYSKPFTQVAKKLTFWQIGLKGQELKSLEVKLNLQF